MSACFRKNKNPDPDIKASTSPPEGFDSLAGDTLGIVAVGVILFAFLIFCTWHNKNEDVTPYDIPDSNDPNDEETPALGLTVPDNF